MRQIARGDGTFEPYKPWSLGRRMAAKRAAVERATRRVLAAYTPITDRLPPVGEWVLAYWHHLDPKRGGRGHKARQTGGWFPTRIRNSRWQAQILSFRTYIEGSPLAWLPILPPDESART